MEAIARLTPNDDGIGGAGRLGASTSTRRGTAADRASGRCRGVRTTTGGASCATRSPGRDETCASQASHDCRRGRGRDNTTNGARRT